MTTATEQFIAEMVPRQRAAEQAIHNGDVEPRLALWGRTDPVTVFGAKQSGSGWAELEPLFRKVAAWFSDSAEYEFEVIAAGASMRSPSAVLTIVHRHADVPPTEGDTI